MGVLPPYRGRGVGTKLVEEILEMAVADEELLDVYLHVQTSNEDAVRFYKRLGFEVRCSSAYRGCKLPARPLWSPSSRPSWTFFRSYGCATQAAPLCAPAADPPPYSQVRECVRNYYRRIEPPDAYLIARPIVRQPKPEDCRA